VEWFFGDKKLWNGNHLGERQAMTALHTFGYALAIACSLSLLHAQESHLAGSSHGQHATQVLIRCDDFGMCHTVNMAVQQVIAAGFTLSVSVMVACPWFPEAVDIL